MFDVEKILINIRSFALSQLKSKQEYLLKCHCIDCLCYSKIFMVHDEVWAQITNNKKDFICLTCSEKRLERKLTIEDFTVAPCNEFIFYGYLIHQRTNKV